MYYRLLQIFKTILVTGTILLFSTALCSQSFAQAALKIGSVDAKKIFDSWSEKLNADKELDPKKKSLEDKQKELQDAQTQYIKQETALTDAAKKAQQENIKSLQKDFQAMYTGVMKEIDTKS